MRAAILFFVVSAVAACHHDTPPAQTAPPERSAPATAPNAAGAMPVGSIKEERGDIRYVNPTLPPPARSDAGTAHP